MGLCGFLGLALCCLFLRTLGVCCVRALGRKCDKSLVDEEALGADSDGKDNGCRDEQEGCRVAPRSLQRLVDQWVARVALQTASLPDAAGWIRVEVPIESEEIALSQFLQLGAEAEVLAPETLRQRMAQMARAMGHIYQHDAGASPIP